VLNARPNWLPARPTRRSLAIMPNPWRQLQGSTSDRREPNRFPRFLLVARLPFPFSRKRKCSVGKEIDEGLDQERRGKSSLWDSAKGVVGVLTTLTAAASLVRNGVEDANGYLVASPHHPLGQRVAEMTKTEQDGRWQETMRYDFCLAFDGV
jgi:hypothetical protein